MQVLGHGPLFSRVLLRWRCSGTWKRPTCSTETTGFPHQPQILCLECGPWSILTFFMSFFSSFFNWQIGSNILRAHVSWLRAIQYNKQRPPFIDMSATYLEANFSPRLSSRSRSGEWHLFLRIRTDSGLYSVRRQRIHFGSSSAG